MKKTKMFQLLIVVAFFSAITAITLIASCGGNQPPDENQPPADSIGGNTPDITVTDSAAPDDDLQVPFGVVSVNFTLDQTVTVTNNGTANLVIGAIASANPLAAPFSIPTDNCSGQTIAPSGSCTLTVRFAPTAAVTSNDSFDIPSNDPDENPVTVSISGTGVVSTVPDITVTDNAGSTTDLQVPFGNRLLNSISNQTVTVTNNGTANLVIGAIASANPLAAPFSIPTDNCSGQTIAPSGSCTLTVRFAPTAAVTSNDSFDIPSNDPDENPVAVSVSGNGVVPNISVNPPSIGFGTDTLCNGITRTATISNTGTGSLSIISITITSGNTDFSIQSNTCLASLSSSSSCNVDVLFSANSGGAKTGNLRILSDDPDTPTLNVGLTGTRVAVCP